MELLNLLFFSIVALCSAVEDTQDKKPVNFPEDLQDFVRRLAHRQMQTTQNLQPGFLPHLNLPQMRSRPESEFEGDDVSIPRFSFQSNSGGEGGAGAYASSSVSMKRPNSGFVDAQASAFASVKDVSNEEHLGDILAKSDGRTTISKSSTPSEYEKSSTLKEEIVATLDEEPTRKGEPYFLKHQQQVGAFKTQRAEDDSFSDVYFVAIVAGCCAVGIFGVISAGICFYKLQKSRKAAADVDYPAYGVTGPNKDVSSPNGDRKLAQSAQMYHYQHQKQQMIAVEKAGSTKNTSASDVDSEEENEEGDYTVYECPGLAPTGEMEVKNPLFHDDSTPVSPPVLTSKSDSNQNN